MGDMRFAKVERPACKVDLRLASCNVADKQFLLLMLNFLQVIRTAHCASVVCTNNVVSAKHFLSSREFGI